MTSGVVNLGVGVYNVLDYGAVGNGTTDDRAACQAAINAAAGNGIVLFPPGKTYYLNSNGPLQLPPGATKLILSGYGATIKLGAACVSFLSFARTTDNQVWQNLTVQGFDVNGNNLLVGAAANTHVVIGTLDVSGVNMGFNNITVEDIYSYNTYTETDPNRTANGRWHIAFYTTTDGRGTSSGTQLTNITVRRCKMLGGVLGTMVAGGTQNGTNTIDQCLFEDLYHDTLVTPTTFAPMSNFQIGSYARVKHAVVRRCYGFNSWDDGIEVNNADPVILVEDCYGENSINGYYALINYTTPTNNAISRVVLRNCHYRVTANSLSTASAFFNVGSAGTNDVSKVEIVNCSSTDQRTPNSGAAYFSGININSGAVIKNLVVRDFTCSWEGWTWNGRSQVSMFMNHIEINGAGSRLLIDGLKCAYRGTQQVAGAATAVFAYPVLLNPRHAESSFAVHNMEVDLAIANQFNGTSELLSIGNTGSGAAVREGLVTGFQINTSSDGSPRALRIGSSSAFAIGSRIAVEHCNFARTASAIYVDDDANSAKIHTRRNVWAGGAPRSPSTVYVPASNATWTNTSMLSGTLVTTGGNVSSISRSSDRGRTFTRLGLTSGGFHVEPGDQVRWTYSVAPAATFVPDN